MGPMTTAQADSMLRWAETAEAVRATRKTTLKTTIVAEYLRGLSDDALPIASRFLSGRAFPEYDPRRTGLGWAAISAAVQEVAGADDDAMRRAYDRSSDLGTSVGELLADVGHRPIGPGPLTLGDVAAGYAALVESSTRASKAAAFAGLIRRAEPLSARYISAILSGELRIGLREGHLEKGIAVAFGRELSDVQWAGMLTGDIGRTAVMAREDRLATAELELFHPLKSMLAAPVIDEAEVLTRLTPPVWVEDKYDGIRAQLHKRGGEVRLFSRDLNDVTGQFPEIGRAAAELGWDGILDGEILAYRDGAVLPFLKLQSRLGRKTPSEAIQADVPVIYVGFDVLALGLGEGVDRAAAAAAPAGASPPPGVAPPRRDAGVRAGGARGRG